MSIAVASGAISRESKGGGVKGASRACATKVRAVESKRGRQCRTPAKADLHAQMHRMACFEAGRPPLREATAKQSPDLHLEPEACGTQKASPQGVGPGRQASST